jgi:protocatechuate 3,4-dioxygenase beta subunit
LTFVPGLEIDGALFRLTRGAVITGRIVDEGGEPMTKVTVASLRKLSAEETEGSTPRIGRDQLQAASTAITDDRGEFRIFDLRPGEYYVQASASFVIGDEDALGWIVRANLGSQYAPVYYPGVIQLDQAQAFVLAAGEEVRAEFAMRQVKTVQVAGRIVASDGKAASDAFVSVSASDGNSWSELSSATTDAKGGFIIKGVAPGSYIINAQQQDQERFLFARQKLEVGNENIDSVLLAFGQGTNISGRVVGAGPGMPARVQIQLEPAHESEMPSRSSAQSKPDGSFQMLGVSDGDYALRVYGMEQGWYVRSARLGGEDVLEKGLQLEKGVTGTLEIVLSSSGAQLEGTVTDHDKPAGGAEVVAKPEPETPYNRMRSRNATTDQNGHFTFRTLPPGKYRVTAKLASASPDTPATASEPKVVTLGERDHQTLQLTLATPQSE